MASGDSSDPIFLKFQLIRVENARARRKFGIELRDEVSSALSEITADGVAKFWNDRVMQHVSELVRSPKEHDKLAGILAAELLSELPWDDKVEEGRTLVQFYSFIRRLLPSETSVMVEAARCLGLILQRGGPTMTDHFLLSEVQGALDCSWPSQSDQSRYTSVLVLKELAMHSPVPFYTHVDDVLEKIPVFLSDSRFDTRQSAADLLSACLDLIRQRDKRLMTVFITKLLSYAANGFSSFKTHSVHAAILTYRSLFTHPDMCLRESYVECMELVWRFRNSKDRVIRRAIVDLIPTMAAYDTTSFSLRFLHGVMGFLLGQLNRPEERSYAFIAIGRIATAVTVQMKVYLPQTIKGLKDSLSNPRKKFDIREEALQCIGLLSIAIGPSLEHFVKHDLLELMFAQNLTEALQMALEDIAKHIPSLLQDVQDRLLNLLSYVLSGKNCKWETVDPTIIRTARCVQEHATKAGVTRKASTSRPQFVHGIQRRRNAEEIALALTTLGTFDFAGHALCDFLRTRAMPWLEDEDATIRQSAALTCCHLFIQDPISRQTSTRSVAVIRDVLDKLVAVAIADSDPMTRQKVLAAMDERFDRLFCQTETIRSLLVGVNDEVFANRKLAISIISRLAVYNPACVVPSLRKGVIQLLTEMEYSTVSRNQEEIAQLLTQLIVETRHLMRPYTVPILKVLLNANDKSAAVMTQILMCLGELAVIGGQELTIHIQRLMSLIMSTLKDQSSPGKQEAALKTLGSLCSHIGYLIEPYTEYPELLPLLARFLDETGRKASFRREVMRVLGRLGACDSNRLMDPRIVQVVPNTTDIAIFDLVAIVHRAGATSEEYYLTASMKSLLNLLKDRSLREIHGSVVDSILSIYTTQGSQCLEFLPYVLPSLLSVIRAAASSMQSYYVQQLTNLVFVIQQHIRPYLREIVSLFAVLWTLQLPRLPLVSLVHALGLSFKGEFRAFLPTVLPKLLEVFDELRLELQVVQVKVLQAVHSFGADVEDYLHLVLPPILQTCERTEVTSAVRMAAVLTIGRLAASGLNLTHHSSRIIHRLIRILSDGDTELRLAVMDTLCALLCQLQSDFTVFISMISKCLLRHEIQHSKYNELVSNLLNGVMLPRDGGRIETYQDRLDVDAPKTKSLSVDQRRLKQAWDISLVAAHDDWLQWIRHLAVELLIQSPSSALRSCTVTARTHFVVARELFNVAFISCWNRLSEDYQMDLLLCLQKIMSTPDVPAEIINLLLDLADFMEHDDKPLNIDLCILEDQAARCHAYAKALRYKELEFIEETDNVKSPRLIENLITQYTMLQQPDAAWGMVMLAREDYKMAQPPEWYEKLGHWREALQVQTESSEMVVSKMRCYHALGEWELLAEQLQIHWSNADQEERLLIAPLAAAAAWNQHRWDLMGDYVSAMKLNTSDRSFYRAVLAVHQNQFREAAQQIDQARDLLDNELTGLLRESYGRAYNCVVRIQMLSELEEIIEYKQRSGQPEVQTRMRWTWTKRIQGCQPDVDVWQRILQVRSLVLSPTDEVDTWLKFSNLCRKSDRRSLAEKTLKTLMGLELSPGNLSGPEVCRAPPQVLFAQMKLMWSEGGHRQQILNDLREFSGRLMVDLGLTRQEDGTRIAELVASLRVKEFTDLLARCFLKQGEWQACLIEQWTMSNPSAVLRAYFLATRFDPGWYKAWHVWALANFDMVAQISNATITAHILPTSLTQHIILAIEGFFRSISLRAENSLQDVLRILNLWFKYGDLAQVDARISDGFRNVSIDTWLQVIPQIIARIQMPSEIIRRLISRLLADVGKAHPQALVYPLTVAAKSPSTARQNASLAVLQSMRRHSQSIVNEAVLVSRELVRVSVLWPEIWHTALEEASIIYFGLHDSEGMIDHLEPFHGMLEKGPETPNELFFLRKFGEYLLEAREFLRRFRISKNNNHLEEAWLRYQKIHSGVTRYLRALTVIDLADASPALLQARNLKLVIPGAYKDSSSVISIAGFNDALVVFASKQRPRRLGIKGSDGKKYEFLLKGHEDLRQDERVMQVFGLVNTLLFADSESLKRHLHIQQFPVIPLSSNSGLLGWVQNTDTLHSLIDEYRKSRNISLALEARLIAQMAPNYDTLPLLQKVEVLEHVLSNTTGQDLYRILWLKSANSEAWIERRTTYTRSLAVASMIGHIIGLGDRHPNNLLLDRGSGRIVHIDFGDCFEVAMNREKFPEKVPFRLTRMLVHAMEVGGVHGSFRRTCEITMQVLRLNKDSLLAVLEALVYDPLINWRLMQDDDDRVKVDKGPEEPLLRPVPGRRVQADESELFNAANDNPRVEARNERALVVSERVRRKLTGRDIDPDAGFSVPAQVQALIDQATSLENLCVLFLGWSPFW